MISVFYDYRDYRDYCFNFTVGEQNLLTIRRLFQVLPHVWGMDTSKIHHQIYCNGQSVLIFDSKLSPIGFRKRFWLFGLRFGTFNMFFWQCDFERIMDCFDDNMILCTTKFAIECPVGLTGLKVKPWGLNAYKERIGEIGSGYTRDRKSVV